MLGDIKVLNTDELKHIIEDPNHRSRDGLKYRHQIDDVKAEYQARLDTGSKDAVTHAITKTLNDETLDIELDPKRKALHDRLAKARASKTPKPDHLKRKGISLTVIKEHDDILAEVGGGNKSRGLSKILSWYLTYESKIFD